MVTSPTHLASREVHWWCVNLDAGPETAAALAATLTSDERDRSARLRFDRDRQRFIIARGALRDILGRYLGTPAGTVCFAHNAFGKPELGPEFGNDLRFNLSHSGDLAVIAIAPRADVGIDLEHVRPQPAYADIAREFFSSVEADHLNSLPRHLQAEAFFSSWTEKEAYAKAGGLGLTNPPMEVSDRRWSLFRLRPAPGYVGALVVEGSGWRPCERRWQIRPS